MEALKVEEILPLDEYERRRADMRARMQRVRQLRRLELGDSCVVIFENRETVRFQVQEMLRVDQTDTPERIALELSCFNLLVPKFHELSATLILRIKEYRDVDDTLKRMSGLTKNCIAVHVGEERIPARFDVEDESLLCTGDMFYIHFAFSEEQIAAFRDPAVPVTLRACHPHCSADIPIVGETRDSLLQDLC
ncbi:MAG: DUF3501 family protein [Bacteroidota bacterium]|jgi:hypothetical protein|nr:DUF3501 family protein [Bacteroidota bacterium]